MAFETEYVSRMNEKIEGMSKGQRKLASFISLNYEKAAFLTAAKLGAEVGVSESTVVRFATLLGYDGYPGFQKAIQEIVKEKLESIDKIEIDNTSLTRSEVLDTVINSDIEKLKYTLSAIDRNAFDEAVESIINAKKIYIVGIRSCASLAMFLSFNLNLIFENVELVSSNNASEMFEQMIRLGAEDVVIGISFPRYSMRTLKAMEFANNRNAKVITITDNKNSPMNLYSSCNLLARSEMSTVVDSLTAPLSVINSLIVAIYLKKKNEVTKTLEELEKVWEDYQVYSSDEINMFDDTVRLHM